MIQILGMKRITALAILAGLNALLALVVYFYLSPHSDTLTQQLQVLTSQTTQNRSKTTDLQTQYQTIQDQKAHFADLTALGFFSNQNRVVAQTRIAEIQKFTNILNAKYNITAAIIEKDQAATDAGYVVLNSPVKIEIEALDDVDVYNFIYWVENAFPGHVSLNDMQVERGADIDENALRQIGSGVPVVLVKATLDFDWRTMIPQNQATPQAGAPKG